VDKLAAALAFDRAVRMRGADRCIDLPDGVVVLASTLPRIYHLNCVLLDAPLAGWLDPSAIVRLADDWLGHLDHRQVLLDDATAGERLEPAFTAAGWARQRTLFMVWSGANTHSRAASDPRGREITDAQLRALQFELFAEERAPRGPAGKHLIAALVAGQDSLRAGTRARCFGAGEGEVLDSSCTLFLERGAGQGGAAMIDEVATRLARRGRGLARAAVARALDVARAEGCDPIVIPADADDWPQLIYAKLGFEPVGQQVTFTLSRTRSIASTT
jgi:GNAT superfamily N-acetyltransferase